MYPEASISAWEHEFKHFLDDEAAGFLGMRSLGNINYRAGTELHAYKTEVDFVKTLKNSKETEIIKQLKLNFKQEIDYISGWGNITDEQLLKDINQFFK